MENRNAIVTLANDIYKGQVNTEFASQNKDEQMATLREALIQANGGNSKITYKKLRNNTELFEIIEQILETVDMQGFEGNPFFERFVDYRNLALGDQADFYIEDDSLFTVDTTAEGIASTLRQRINKGKTETIGTTLKTIEVYENVNRLLAGRIDIVQFVERIRASFELNRMNSIYTAFVGGVSKLPATFKATGSYSEAVLLDFVAHVEASTGQNAVIVGTQKALGKITTAVVSEAAKSKYNDLGYYGTFNGTDMLRIKQSHVQGTYDFAVTDSVIWVMAGDNKFVKFVTEGEAIFETGDIMKNKDRTMDIFAGERWGTGVVISQNYAQYTLS